MPSLRDEAKYYCPYCKETNYIEDEEYDAIQLKSHFEAFHGYSSKTLEKFYCQECSRRRALGDLNVKPKKVTPFWMFRHMQKKGCYRVPETEDQQENIAQEEQEEMLVTFMENSDMEAISQTIEEENKEAEDNIFDDLIDLENIHNDPHKKSLKTVLKYFSKLLNDNGTTNKNLELYLQSHQEHGLTNGNMFLTDTIESLLRIVRDDFVNEIRVISPFDPEETIFESITNVEEGNLERPIGDNKKNLGVLVSLKYIFELMCKNQKQIVETYPNKIPLQLYCDELNMNTFSNGLLQYLHVALRISGDYADISKIESVYTVAILPTYKLNTINNSEAGGRYVHFFRQFKNIFDMNCNVKFEGRNITFVLEDLLGDHCFLDHYWGINAANSDKGDNPSCRICLIPPNQYIDTVTLESLESKYPDLRRSESPQDPIFKNCKNMIYSDWFHDLNEGIISSSCYVIMQELCTNNDEFPRLQPYEISGLLLKEFKERKTSGKIFQNIGVQLEQNIISKRLSLKQETKRMSINFGSGFGNLEAMWCLHNAITELVVKYRSEKLLNFKNVLHSYGSLCNMCMKSDKLNDDDYRILRNLCNETVERTLKLTRGRYGFSKKLHYILHYPEIAKNFHDQLKNIATSRFESKHQCIKKYFTSSNNKMFPAKTIIKKSIMRTKLSSMLIGN